MTDWRAALRETDPGAHAQLSNDDAQAMRRAVLAALPARVGSDGRMWVQPLLLAATVALMIVTGAAAGRHASVEPAGGSAQDTAVATETPEMRQLQFATPGGTRIIWTFNSAFNLNESIP